MIDAVITGCDRIAANGDVANKIGTHTLSVCASHYGVPHYVIGPTSTIDPACTNGSEIVIEQRDSREVTEMWYSKRMAPVNIKVFNPAFDITPSSLISAIITEEGIFRYPYRF
jgi:methylthioribose-1-phosphate isomerase